VDSVVFRDTVIDKYKFKVTGTFAPRNFRSRERKFHGVELSLPGAKVPWNFRSLELSFPGTFAP